MRSAAHSALLSLVLCSVACVTASPTTKAPPAPTLPRAETPQSIAQKFSRATAIPVEVGDKGEDWALWLKPMKVMGAWGFELKLGPMPTQPEVLFPDLPAQPTLAPLPEMPTLTCPTAASDPDPDEITLETKSRPQKPTKNRR